MDEYEPLPGTHALHHGARLVAQDAREQTLGVRLDGSCSPSHVIPFTQETRVYNVER